MQWIVLVLLLALLTGPSDAAEAVSPAPSSRLPAEIGDLALADGRMLRSAVIVSQTGLAINVRHAGGLTKVEKRRLPPELLVRFPIDEAQASREEQSAKESLARRDEQAQIAALWTVRPALPGSREANRYAGFARPKSPTPATAEAGVRVATPAEQAARAPTGLYITTWANLTGGEIKFEVVNPTTVAKKMEPRELVALRLDNGRSVPGNDLRFPMQEKADPWVPAGGRRSFRVQFSCSVPIAAVAWSESGEWRVSGPHAEAAAVASEDEAMTLARANDKAAQEKARMEANKARAAKALDKLDDRLIGR